MCVRLCFVFLDTVGSYCAVNYANEKSRYIVVVPRALSFYFRPLECENDRLSITAMQTVSFCRFWQKGIREITMGKVEISL